MVRSLLPPVLSLLRLLLAPLLPVVAYRGGRTVWALLVTSMVGIDLVDGILARRWCTAFALDRQRRLDHLADLALFLVAPGSALMLARPLTIKERIILCGYGLCAGGSAVLAFWRFRRLPRYRTELFRWTAGGALLGVAARVASRNGSWCYQISLALHCLAHIEALVITLLLPTYRTPIYSILTIRRPASPLV